MKQFQGGLNNDELLAAWKQKLPAAEPQGQELNAFAVGIEFGFDHARALERQDWSRVHYALAKHKAHPGRTDDHLADVIDREIVGLHSLLAGLQAEADSLHMAYRMKYDKETKAQAVEIEQLRAALLGLLQIHTEPAGYPGKFGRELDLFLEVQKVKIDALVADAKTALRLVA